MKKVVIAGAGAAGMMAAGLAARAGCDITLVEKNEKPGRKLMITGKGRCNVTNNCDIDEFLANVPVHPKFLYSALHRFGPSNTIRFFEDLGIPLKTERGKRVFPQSDHAADIVDALRRYAAQGGARLLHGSARALHIDESNGIRQVRGLLLEDGRELPADAVLLCTGGKSYPLTGSTGDGYRIAEQAGHHIMPVKPSLVPIETAENWPAELQGLSLKNIRLSVTEGKKQPPIFDEIGEMLFTHFGISGPLVLSASSHIRSLGKKSYTIRLDLKPGLTPQQLDLRLQRDFVKYSNHDFINSLGDLLPRKLIPVIVRLSDIPPDCKVHQITREMRTALVDLIKRLEMTPKAFRPIAEAIITSGGVDIKEVDPSTMQSKLVRGLYFAGEILDVDAHTGGFNLQIAFSTGYAAGISISLE